MLISSFLQPHHVRRWSRTDCNQTKRTALGAMVLRKDANARASRRRRAFKKLSETFKADGTRIGDGAYADMRAEATYNWELARPASGHSDRLVGIPRLTTKCAEIVACNCYMLSLQHLAEAPWSVWRFVWQSVMAMHLDSPAVFGLFASAFCEEVTFRCHTMLLPLLLLILAAKIRQHALGINLARLRLHRMENVFVNVSFKSLSAFVHYHDLLLLLDVSRVPSLDPDVPFPLANLTALDISNHPTADDYFLLRLAQTIADRRTLKVLVIHSCPKISSVGVKRFMGRCPVDYIETSHNLVTTSFSSRLAGTREPTVEDTRYDQLDVKESQILCNLPPGLKIHALRKRIDLKSSILFDVLVVPRAFSGSMEPAWQEREARRDFRRVGYGYILRPHAPKRIPLVSSGLQTSAKRLKPRTDNVKDFFDLA